MDLQRASENSREVQRAPESSREPQRASDSSREAQRTPASSVGFRVQVLDLGFRFWANVSVCFRGFIMVWLTSLHDISDSIKQKEKK